MAYHEEEIAKITKRHIARILNNLNEIDTPEIAIVAVKKQMWFLTDDLVEQLKTGNINENRF